jgi:hypothetical protein
MNPLQNACLAFIAFAFLACAAASANLQASHNVAALSHSKLNSSARLISGLPSSSVSKDAFAQTPAWKQHSEFMRDTWARLNSGQVSAMTTWRDAELGKACPAGKTLMYPFSGPDFFNAYWLFPGCETFVMFGLEHIGEVPDIEKLNERELTQLLADVRAAMSNFVDRNYFITQNMARQMRTSQLRGVLPIFMLSMALTGMDIVSVLPNELPPTPGTAMSLRGHPMRPLKGVTIEFRAPGSKANKRVHYFSVDATDKGIVHYPEFLAFVRGLAPTTTFIKSASYLLHRNEFRGMRDALLDISRVFVQDDSGLPYGLLDKRAWEVQLYGRYGRPIPPFGGAYQPGLERAYGSQALVPLPFTFGYQYHDFRDHRSNLMIAHRTVGRSAMLEARKPR